jgi:uncharacterized membrane protein
MIERLHAATGHHAAHQTHHDTKLSTYVRLSNLDNSNNSNYDNNNNNTIQQTSTGSTGMVPLHPMHSLTALSLVPSNVPKLWFLFALISAIIGSFVQLFAKMAAQLLRDTFAGDDQFAYALTYAIMIVMALSAASNVHFLNLGLREGDVLLMIPVYYVLSLVMTVIGGIIFFQTYVDFGAASTLLFSASICCTLLGVMILTQRSSTSNAFLQHTLAECFCTECATYHSANACSPRVSKSFRSTKSKSSSSSSNASTALLPSSSSSRASQPAYSSFDV